MDPLSMVFDWLRNEKNGRWLLVLDGAEEPGIFFGQNAPLGSTAQDRLADSEALARYLLQTPNVSILVTSRFDTAALKLVRSSSKLIRVETMPEQTSLELLKAKILNDKMDENAGIELIRALEGIPLAISQAAAYLNSRSRMPVSEYIRYLKETEANQVHLLSNDEAGHLRRDPEVSSSVILTWQMSFE